jgi:thymidylate kinase
MSLLVNFEAIESLMKKSQAALLVETLSQKGYLVNRQTLPDRPRGDEDVPATPEQALTWFVSGNLISKYIDHQMPLLKRTDSLFRSTNLCNLPEAEQIEVASIIEEKIFQVLMSMNRRQVIGRPGGLAQQMLGADIVVCERLISARAYAVAMGVSAVEIDALEGDFPKADLNILLDINPANISNGETQKYRGSFPQIRRLYDELIEQDAAEVAALGRRSRWVKIDASLPEKKIQAQILDLVLDYLDHPLVSPSAER